MLEAEQLRFDGVESSDRSNMCAVSRTNDHVGILFVLAAPIHLRNRVRKNEEEAPNATRVVSPRASPPIPNLP